ncbi:MAG TPA: thioredoxin, partial [Gammaproteobacteria bacterium]|nr:thioredoxin [Gammaproteobacteria bacterium]
MRAVLIVIVYLCLSSTVIAADADEGNVGELQGNPGYIPEPTWFKNSFLDIREDLDEARDEGRRLLLYFYQDGCPYCKKLLQDNFGQPPIRDLAKTHFDTLAINLWGDREVTGFAGESLSEKDFARGLRVQFTPTMLLMDDDGEVALRINGYYSPPKFVAALRYVGERHEQTQSFSEYVRSQSQQVAKVTASNRYAAALPAPLQLADALRTDARPMMVIFDQANCQACDELYTDILRRPETHELISRLHVATVDRWSDAMVQTPANQRRSAKDWANDLGVQYAPTMVFF